MLPYMKRAGFAGISGLLALGCAQLLRATMAAGAPQAGSGAPVRGMEDRQNDVTRKHCDFEVVSGNVRCVPKGVMKVIADDLECGVADRGDLSLCKAGVLALKGELDPGARELFLDLVSMRPDAAEMDEPALSDFKQYWMSFGNSTPKYIPNMGVSGLAFVGKPDDGAALAAMVATPKLQDRVGTMKQGMVNTLYWMDARAHVPTMNTLLASGVYTNDHQEIGLEYFYRWQVNAAVPWCIGALKGDEALSPKYSTGTQLACVKYLGRMKAMDAEGLIVRGAEQYGGWAVRSLAAMGSGKAKPLAQEQLAKVNKKDYYQQRIPQLGALVELGDTGALKDLSDYVLGNANASPMAAMELTLVQNAKMDAGIAKTLKQAGKQKGQDFRPWLYAQIALAQRGDPAAAKVLAGELNGPNQEIRDRVLDAIGGSLNPANAFELRGLGVVASPELLPALSEYIGMESDTRRQQTAMIAWLSIREAVRKK